MGQFKIVSIPPLSIPWANLISRIENLDTINDLNNGKFSWEAIQKEAAFSHSERLSLMGCFFQLKGARVALLELKDFDFRNVHIPELKFDSDATIDIRRSGYVPGSFLTNILEAKARVYFFDEIDFRNLKKVPTDLIGIKRISLKWTSNVPYQLLELCLLSGVPLLSFDGIDLRTLREFPSELKGLKYFSLSYAVIPPHFLELCFKSKIPKMNFEHVDFSQVRLDQFPTDLSAIKELRMEGSKGVPTFLAELLVDFNLLDGGRNCLIIPDLVL